MLTAFGWVTGVCLYLLLVRLERRAKRIDGRYNFIWAVLGAVATVQFSYEHSLLVYFFAPMTGFAFYLALHQHYVCGDATCPHHYEGRRELDDKKD